MPARSARVLAATALLAAVPARGALGPLYGGQVTVSVDDLPARFDPAQARGPGARLVSALVHERLAAIDGDGRPAPALAAGWTEGAGGREWTVRLHPGSTFHDGAALTSEDVVRSLQRFLRSPSPAAAVLARALDGGERYRSRASSQLAGVAAPASLDVVLRLRRAAPVALGALAAGSAAITSARGAGAGPFVPTTASPIRGRAAFVPFAGHVRGRPYLDGVTLGVTSGGAARGDLAPAPGAGPLAATLILALDPAARPFDRLQARREAAAAVDAADLVRHFLPEGAAASSLLPPSLLPSLPDDAPTARPPRTLSGTIALAVATDVPAAVSQRVVAYLGAAGLQVVTRPASPDGVWTSPASARLALFVPEVADPLLALEELAALLPSAASGPFRGLVERAAAEADRDRREALLHRAQAALRSGSILLPLATVPLGFRGRPGLHGVVVDASGRIRLEDAWIEP